MKGDGRAVAARAERMNVRATDIMNYDSEVVRKRRRYEGLKEVERRAVNGDLGIILACRPEVM